MLRDLLLRQKDRLGVLERANVYLPQIFSGRRNFLGFVILNATYAFQSPNAEITEKAPVWKGLTPSRLWRECQNMLLSEHVKSH